MRKCRLRPCGTDKWNGSAMPTGPSPIYRVDSRGARWPSGLERWLRLATGRSQPGWNTAAATSLRNFGNSIYAALPVSFVEDTKSGRSLLSGVYVR